MIDSYVFLTPFLLLGVIALLGFVGCNQFYGLEETQPIGPPDPPTNLVATPGDRLVGLTWDTDPQATSYHVLRATASGTTVTDYPVQQVVYPAQLPYTDYMQVVNGTKYFYRVTAVTAGGESDISEEASATPQSPYGPFIQVTTGGTVRNANPDNAWYGMVVRCGAIPITVRELGRIHTLGMTQNHMVRLVDAATKADIGVVTVTPASSADGDYKYEQVLPAVDLVPGQSYYVLSQERAMGDQFLEQDATVTQRRPEANISSAVYSDAPGLFVPVGMADHAYVPVNFKY
ncbi:MAG TPA: fibronectin type III domain-containing protein [Gemmatimonadaceae bacterium]|nr:fibronectin type III domain-containing protein [Gemmatimonadaceae bacterium]